jgi:hypothetical protein
MRRGKLELFRKINNERNFWKIKEQESQRKNKRVLKFFFFSIEKTKLDTSLFMPISYFVCVSFDIFIHSFSDIYYDTSFLTKIYLKLYNV